MQLSPIFGLFSDPRNEVTNLLYQNLGRPELTGTLDGVKNDLWSVIDAEVENQVIDLMGTKPVYIADGHHRYTTALQYQHEAGAGQRRQAAAAGAPGELVHVRPRRHAGRRPADPADAPPDRRARRLRHRRVPRRRRRQRSTSTETPLAPDHVDEYVDNVLPAPARRTRSASTTAGRRSSTSSRCKNPDVLAPLEPNQSDAWRRLDVAILQRYLLDEVLQPKFAGGKELTKGYTADAERDRRRRWTARSTRSPCCSSPRRSARWNSSASTAKSCRRRARSSSRSWRRGW